MVLGKLKSKSEKMADHFYTFLVVDYNRVLKCILVMNTLLLLFQEFLQNVIIIFLVKIINFFVLTVFRKEVGPKWLNVKLAWLKFIIKVVSRKGQKLHNFEWSLPPLFCTSSHQANLCCHFFELTGQL